MSYTALRRALGLVCVAGIGFSAALVLNRTRRTAPLERDERLLRRAVDALREAFPPTQGFTVTAHAGRVLVSGRASRGDEARIERCLRELGVCAMQLSISEAAV